MGSRDVFPTGWSQQVLIEPQAIEARLRIGIVPASNHAQIQIEVMDPGSKTLIAMESKPHLSLSACEATAKAFFDRLMQETDKAINAMEPFPDKP